MRPETAKFLPPTFIGAFRGMVSDKKDVTDSSRHLFQLAEGRRRKRGKVRREAKGGNYFRGVEIIFDRLEN